jgi:hypothetical protein
MCPLGRMREGMVGRIGGIIFCGVWAYKKSEVKKEWKPETNLLCHLTVMTLF